MDDLVQIDADLVRRLVASQFPDWSGLPVVAVSTSGWDNRTFRLGTDLVVRMPSAAAYAGQVGKEQQWLPRLAAQLPLVIPSLLGLGKPEFGYPWQWSVLRWIEGHPASERSVADMRIFARDLGGFLAAMHQADTTGGPRAGEHSFHRGAALDVYDGEINLALARLGDWHGTSAASKLWRTARATCWRRDPVWVHGDIAPGNLLVRGGRLCAVIDFGQLCIGDPACDLMIAWSWMDATGREALRATLPLDKDTWLRGRAWALWKALNLAAGLAQTSAVEYADPWRVIEAVLEDAE